MSMLSTLGLFLLGPKKTRSDSTPPVEDIHDVLPLHVLDDTAGNRSLFLAWTMRFDDVLDANMLHCSLVKLLQREGWRKLGGRLRLNVSLMPGDDSFFQAGNVLNLTLTDIGEAGSACAPR